VISVSKVGKVFGCFSIKMSMKLLESQDDQNRDMDSGVAMMFTIKLKQWSHQGKISSTHASLAHLIEGM